MKDFRPVFERTWILEDYPSGSTVGYLDGSYYVMGDDASHVAIFDLDFKDNGTIDLFPKGADLRLPKASKADIESSVVIKDLKGSQLLFLGSGSVSPFRDSAFLFNPANREIKRIEATEFFSSLRIEVSELNIEAAAANGQEIILGSRGNQTYPGNFLISAEFREHVFSFKRKIILQLPIAQAGISGMDLDEDQDVLFITFSSEATANSYDDGQIGESYLVCLPDARKHLQSDTISISNMIALSSISPEFKNQKIESVSLTGQKNQLMLVSDDDRGNTKLFTLRY